MDRSTNGFRAGGQKAGRETRSASRAFFALAAMALFACLAADALAQQLDPGKRVTQYVHATYGSELGLKETLDLLQDEKGFLWLASYDGPIRFDGVEFVRDFPLAEGSVAPRSARVFARGGDGTLWIGTNEQGVAIRSGDAYSWIDAKSGLPNDSIRKLLVDRKGRGWIGTVSGLALWDAGRVKTFPEYPELMRSQIAFLCEDSTGRVWIGTSAGTVYVAAAEKVSPAPDSLAATLSSERVVDMIRSGDSLLALGSRRLLRVSGDRVVETLDPKSDIGFSPALQRVYEDRAGSTWLGYDGGLLRLREGRFEAYTPRDGLGDMKINAILQDREGSVWVATGKGVERFSESRFLCWGLPEGLRENVVNAVLAVGDEVWLGTNGGLSRLDARSGEIENFSDERLSAFRVRHLAVDREGVVWVAAYGSGLYGVVDGKIVRSFTKEDGLAGNKVRTMIETRDGALVVGTTTGVSVISRDRASVRSYGPADGMAFEYVMCLWEDEAGTVWIGSDGSGIQLWKDGVFGKRLTKADGLAGDVVFRVAGIAGDVWVTASGGITRIRGDRLFTYAAEHGVPSSSTFELVPDRAGGLWLVTSDGIFSATLAGLDAVFEGREARFPVVVFDKRAGLRELPTAVAFSGADARGRVWFPTQAGVAMIDPASIARNEISPYVVVERAVFDGRPLPPGSSATMAAEDRRVEFRFAAPSFVAPDSVRVEYLLEGFESEWQSAGRRREASYTNLAPGDYRFVVRAFNSDGVLSTQTGLFTLSKLPHFWQTAWFVALASVAGLVLVGGGFRFAIVARTRTFKARLERQEKELELERKAVESERRAKETESSLRESYSRFVPSEFVELLGGRGVTEVRLGDHVEREMCVLFSDIRGFTALSEQMTPAENFDFLNDYLRVASPIIRDNGGFVDKYIGDAIMAVFPGDPERAFKAAVGLQDAVRAFNASDWRGRGFRIAAGVGLHVGYAMVGTIGEEHRMDATVISDAVNIASRLEGLNKFWGTSVIVSKEVSARLASAKDAGLRFLAKVHVVGRKKPLQLFHAYCAEEPSQAEFLHATRPDYHEGMKRYLERDFEGARACFARVLSANPRDKVADHYLRRAARFADSGVGDDWDGAESADGK